MCVYFYYLIVFGFWEDIKKHVTFYPNEKWSCTTKKVGEKKEESGRRKESEYINHLEKKWGRKKGNQGEERKSEYIDL